MCQFWIVLKNTVNMLGLNDYISKGYYTHEFTDLNYKGPVPDKSFFSTNNMNDEELKRFEKWYEKKGKN